jgi:Ran GTPase-activating protein (RanGAP) involved in mRNA processing and transport
VAGAKGAVGRVFKARFCEFAPAIAQLQQLEVLDMSQHMDLKLEQASALAELSRLHVLRIVDHKEIGTCVDAAAPLEVLMQVLADALPKLGALQQLVLSLNNLYCTVGDVQMEKLAGALSQMTQLQLLDLTGHTLGGKGCEKLAAALACMPDLRHLNVSPDECDMDGQFISELRALVPGIRALSKLEVFICSQLYVTMDFGDYSLSVDCLLDACEDHAELRVFHINGGPVCGCDAAESVAKWIAKHTKLEEINLNGCGLRKGMLQVSAALKDLWGSASSKSSFYTKPSNCFDAGCAFRHAEAV